MKPLTTLTLSGLSANASDVLRNFPPGQVALGLILHGELPVTNSGDGSLTGTEAMVAKILDHFLNLTVKYGPSQNRTQFASVKGSELLAIYRLLNQDFPTNNVVGETIAKGSYVAKIDMMILFDAPLYSSDCPRLPGCSQMRTMRLDVQEGASAAIDTDLDRDTGNATWQVTPITRPGADQWAPLLTFSKVNSYSLIADAPAGLPLAVWEATAKYESTALTRFALDVGEANVHDNLAPAYVHADYNRNLDQGGSNPEDTVTVLYAADRGVKLEDAPHGKVRFQQASQDLSPIQLRTLYYPAMTEAEGQEAAVSAAKEFSVPILASVAGVRDSAAPGAAACAPVRLFHTGEPEFVLSPGVIGQANGQVAISVPEVVARQASQIAAGADRTTATQAVAKVIRAVAKRIPGAISAEGALTGVAGSEIRKVIK